MNPKIIALYLPQFHPIPENDEWWGKGFTEWTNVGKAKPLWKGHNQPRVPTDLGYYDLRLPEIREQQAELAREAGVTAFCYWHYWFGNGRQLLERPFNEVLASGQPDFPFCLAWANHSWRKKGWSNEKGEDMVLIEQIYSGKEDAWSHFQWLLSAFKDERYVKIEGKPLMLIFKPDDMPQEYRDWFQQWALEAGFPGLYLVANLYGESPKEEWTAKGYSAVLYNRMSGAIYDELREMNPVQMLWSHMMRLIRKYVAGMPQGASDYAHYYHWVVTDKEYERDVIPQIMPQWDHSPRSSGKSNVIYYNATPTLFKEQVLLALEAVREKPEEEQIIFVKSWNEWGEGNYMEPDLTHGKGFIRALREALEGKDMADNSVIKTWNHKQQ